MKLTVVLLVLLGIVAAVCAVVLVNTLRIDSMRASEADLGEVSVVLAAESLPAMSVLTKDCVCLEQVEGSDAPKGHFCTPTQVVGKILSVPVVEGQIITDCCLVAEGSGARIAAALPPGMRAVSVNLSSQTISGGLLYPGCVVDVLASFKLSGGDRSKGEAISTTLLHAVPVLAIAGDSVVSNPDTDEADEEERERRASSRRLTVTLQLDTRQAEALQLATDNGCISLAMRNPLDVQPVDVDATILSRGRLTKLGGMLSPTVMPARVTSALNVAPASVTDPNQVPVEPPVPQPGMYQAFFGSEPVEEKPEHWQVTVIRGNDVKEEALDVEKD